MSGFRVALPVQLVIGDAPPPPPVEGASDESGVFKLWLDGTQVLDYKGRTLTLGLERYNFLKIGIYQCCNTGLNYQGKTKILPAKAYFTKPIRSSKSLLPK